MKVGIYLYTDIKGPRRKDGTAMYVIEAVKEDKTFTRTGMIPIQNANELEAEVKALRTASERFSKSCSLLVFTNCGAVSGAYKNGWLRKWKENDWKNSKGDTVAASEDWQVIDRILGDDVEVNLGTHTYLSWMESEVKRWNTKRQ